MAFGVISKYEERPSELVQPMCCGLKVSVKVMLARDVVITNPRKPPYRCPGMKIRLALGENDTTILPNQSHNDVLFRCRIGGSEDSADYSGDYMTLWI